MEVNYKELGTRIRRYRQAVHMTQEQLAEQIDMATSNISHIERATTQVSLPSLVKIANVLGVTLDQLICDSLPSEAAHLEGDIADILADCSAAEKRIIRDIASAAKRALRENRG